MNFENELQRARNRAGQRASDVNVDHRIFIGSGKDGMNSESKFSDALEILKSKKRVFLQSIRFVQSDSKMVELFLDADLAESGGIRNTNIPQTSARSVRGSKQIEEGPSSKDQGAFLSRKRSSHRPSKNILVLTPTRKVMGTPEQVRCGCSSLHSSHQRFKNTGEKAKPPRFSFKDIKRIWKSAMGEKPQPFSSTSVVSLHKIPTRKLIRTEVGDRESPGFTRRKLAKAGDKSCYAKHNESEILEEVKKHLSERLRIVNKSEILRKERQTVRTLEGILSSPQDHACSPRSPSWNTKNSPISTERTLSATFSTKDNHESNGEDASTFEVTSERINMDFTGAIHSPDAGFSSSVLASPPRERILSRSSFDVTPTSPLSPKLVVDSVKDGEEDQSPVSVLKSVPVEEDIPKSMETKPSKMPQTDSEEYGLISPRELTAERIDSMNEDGVISTYMRAVVRGAGLNWDDPLPTRPLSDQVLDTSFSHAEKLSETKLQLDPKLLFDCVNYVLLEVYHKHFGSSPWTWYLKPTIGGFPAEDRFFNEVIEDVKRLLPPQSAQPTTLDQLIEHDVAKSASLLDIQVDVEETVNQITEDVLEELVTDTVLCFHHPKASVDTKMHA